MEWLPLYARAGGNVYHVDLEGLPLVARYQYVLSGTRVWVQDHGRQQRQHFDSLRSQRWSNLFGLIHLKILAARLVASSKPIKPTS